MRRSILKAPWALTLGGEAAWPTQAVKQAVSHCLQVVQLYWQAGRQFMVLVLALQHKLEECSLLGAVTLISHPRVQLCQKAGWRSMADGVRSSQSGRVLVQQLDCALPQCYVRKKLQPYTGMLFIIQLSMCNTLSTAHVNLSQQAEHPAAGVNSRALMPCATQCQHLLSVMLQGPELSCECMQVLPIFNMSLPRYSSHFGSFGRGVADGHADCLHW